MGLKVYHRKPNRGFLNLEIKSDQNGIERLLSADIERVRSRSRIKSDQNGIESPNKFNMLKQIMIKSDQNGIESDTCIAK